MAQTYPVMECIIVDDASPDDSIDKCERLMADYDGSIRFIIIHHDHNRGLSAARNTGADIAKGDYIFYLDSDDEITFDCIEKLAAPIERDASIEMVVGNYQVFSDNPSTGKIAREEEFISSEAVRKCFFDERIMYVMAWNKLIAKKFLMDHDLFFMDGILYEDNLWTFYVLKYLQHLYVIPDIVYNHYKHPLSITTGTDKIRMANNFSIIFEDMAKHFTPGEENREAKCYFDSYFKYFMMSRGVEGYQRALPFFEKALASSDNRREHLLLLVLKLSSRTASWYWTLHALMKIRLAALAPLRRLASSGNTRSHLNVR